MNTVPASCYLDVKRMQRRKQERQARIRPQLWSVSSPVSSRISFHLLCRAFPGHLATALAGQPLAHGHATPGPAHPASPGGPPASVLLLLLIVLLIARAGLWAKTRRRPTTATRIRMLLDNSAGLGEIRGRSRAAALFSARMPTRGEAAHGGGKLSVEQVHGVVNLCLAAAAVLSHSLGRGDGVARDSGLADVGGGVGVIARGNIARQGRGALSRDIGVVGVGGSWVAC